MLKSFVTGAEPLIIIPVIISGAVLNTWLFNHTNGSVLIAMILHASVNTWVGIFNPLFSGPDAQMQIVWLVVVYVAVAILLPVLAGSDLARKPAAAQESLATDQPLAAK